MGPGRGGIVVTRAEDARTYDIPSTGSACPRDERRTRRGGSPVVVDQHPGTVRRGGAFEVEAVVRGGVDAPLRVAELFIVAGDAGRRLESAKREVGGALVAGRLA